MIKAPFNFVPVSRTVYFPEWASRISHDVPFSDGVSGHISVKITAETPIFIRNGHSAGTSDNRFSQTADGVYFIPGTSIKGELRSVLKILSFGKMEQVQNKRFGFRDLSTSKLGKLYIKKIKPQNIHCGWLFRKDAQYTILDCGLPYRIAPKDIDAKLNTEFEKFVTNGDFRNDQNRTAKVKYEKIKEHIGSEIYKGRFKLNQDNAKSRAVVICDSDDSFPGYLILTGQSSRRKHEEKNGKYYEFVFPEIEDAKNLEHPVGQNLIQDFFDIHKKSPDFIELWEEKLRKGERIPVFFSFKDASRLDEIEAIGLSYMFKYPAANMIYTAMPIDHLMKNIPDLADCIFGYINKAGNALKGRVSVSDAFAYGECKEEAETSLILSSPAPSYYPLYVQGGRSWNENGVQVAGRKRYPVRDKVMQTGAGTEEMKSTIIPLSPGSTFKCKIRFFNLRNVELGALLSAVTFMGKTECYHNIGEAKPLGYGKVKMEILDGTVFSENSDVETYIEDFKQLMKAEIGSMWESSTQLRELFMMAKGIPSGEEDKFTYMKMSTLPNENEFKICKDNQMHLPLFSDILTGQEKTSSLSHGVAADSEQQYLEDLQLEIGRNEAKKIDELTGGLNSFIRAQELYKEGRLSEAEVEIKNADKYKDYILVKSGLDELAEKIKAAEAGRRNEYENLMARFKAAEKEKDFSTALSILQEAVKYGYEDLSSEISRIEKNRELDSFDSIEVFLASVNLASPAAFANILRKWTAIHGEISDEQAESIGIFLKGKLGTMNKKSRDDWNNIKKWRDIEKIIGLTIAEKIHRMIAV